MNEIILSVQHVTQRFGGLTAINDVSLELHKGEIAAIIGPNGAGKTTLFNIITGIYNPTEGTVQYRERKLEKLKPFQVNRLGLARTFQNIRLFNNMTVLENVMLGVHSRSKAGFADAILRLPRHRKEEVEIEKKAEEMLDLAGLLPYRYEYASSLPYGYQRRLEIARAIASRPEILLLDEPAAGMNEQETSDLMDFIRKLRDLGYTILLIEHDMRLVMNICTRIYVLNYGALIAQGDPGEIRTNQDVIEAYLGKEA